MVKKYPENKALNVIEKPMPKMSILVITYNHELYIAKALEGILMQETEFDYEINVVDDCSTDRSQEIILRYQQQYPDKIKTYFNPKNIGTLDPPQQKVTYEAFKTLKGSYFAILEGDDYWTSPHKLQKQISFLESNPEFVACAHNTIKIYEDGSIEPHRFFYRENNKTEHTIDDFVKMTSFFHLNTIVYRNVLKGVPLPAFRSKWSCDVSVNMLHMQYGKLHYFDEDMSVYRCHKGGKFSQLPEVTARIFHIEGLPHYNHWLGYRYTKALSGTLHRACVDLLKQTSNGNLPPLPRYTRLKYGVVGYLSGKIHDLLSWKPGLRPAGLSYRAPSKGSTRRKDSQIDNPKAFYVNMQLFYADSLAFIEQASVSAIAEASEGGFLGVRFNLPKSPKYLRLDIGHYFAEYEKVSLVINRSFGRKVRLEGKQFLANNQVVWQEDQLVCGYDASVVFENPFIGSNISIEFEARFLFGLACLDNLSGVMVIDEHTRTELTQLSKMLFRRAQTDSSNRSVRKEEKIYSNR